MDNIVKLVFQSIAQGSGFAKVSSDTANLRKNLGFAGHAANRLGQAFGEIGNLAGGALGAVLRGNFWELGALALHKTISLVKDHNKLMKDAALAARGLSSEYMSLEKIAAGYQKRVESWKRRAEEADRAEKEASDKKKQAIDAYLESQKKAEEFATAYAAAEHKIAAESQKAGLASDNEIVRLRTKVKLMMDEAKVRVAAAQEQVRLKAKHGDEQGMALAKKDLELAVVQQANAVREAKKLVAEYKKAKALKDEETEQTMEKMRREDAILEEQTRKKTRLEKAQGEVRKKYADAVKKIEDEIARKKEESARLEANALRARGVSFGDWMKDERNRARDKRTSDRQQAIRESSVDAEIARLEKTNPRTRTAWQNNRLAKLKEWKADQNPNNNPAEKDLKALADKRDKLVEEQNQKLERIAKLLEEAVKL